MSEIKIYEKSTVTNSKDSSWQEWFDEESYVYDKKTKKIHHIISERFENMRRRSEDWEKIISKKEVNFDELPEAAKEKFEKLKYNK